MSRRALRYASTASMPAGMRERAEHQLQRLQTTPSSVERGDARRKYGNSPTRVDGIRFDSKREARYYERLKLEQSAGVVNYFLRQVPLHMPGGTKLVVDFVVVMATGEIRYIDAKGRETQTFRLKRREIEHHYPIRLELV